MTNLHELLAQFYFPIAGMVLLPKTDIHPGLRPTTITHRDAELLNLEALHKEYKFPISTTAPHNKSSELPVLLEHPIRDR